MESKLFLIAIFILFSPFWLPGAVRYLTIFLKYNFPFSEISKEKVFFVLISLLLSALLTILIILANQPYL